MERLHEIYVRGPLWEYRSICGHKVIAFYCVKFYIRLINFTKINSVNKVRLW